MNTISTDDPQVARQKEHPRPEGARGQHVRGAVHYTREGHAKGGSQWKPGHQGTETRRRTPYRATKQRFHAKKCPVCQDVHMFNSRKHEGVQFPSTRFNNWKEFRELSPKHKVVVLEEQSVCLLCTCFAHKRDRCHQRRQGHVIRTCRVLEDNIVCGRERHPMLHLSRGNYRLMYSCARNLQKATAPPT